MRCRRPGILVLVNDVDWELRYLYSACYTIIFCLHLALLTVSLCELIVCFCSGQLETVIEDGDVVVFISTLHGG